VDAEQLVRKKWRRLKPSMDERMRRLWAGAEAEAIGPRYSPLDIDTIATQLHGLVPKDARAEVIYDGYRARFSVLFHSNIEPEHCVAGEIFKAGVSITTADDGTGAIRIAAQVWRNLCRNLIIVQRADQTSVTRHVGQNLGERNVGGAQALRTDHIAPSPGISGG
jgi:hypothetical protein